jgi:uncharacterized protein YwqG
MTKDELRQLVGKDEDLVPHLDYILSIAKPSVDIALVKGKPDAGGSRFGGNPFVPPGFTWPAHAVGEYRFLGQINFADIENAPARLPGFGLLSLFYAYDEDGDVFWQDEDYILGSYWPNSDGFAVHKSPQPDAPITREIKLQGSLNLPRHEELRDDWPLDRDDLDALIYLTESNNAYLMGYPSFTTLAYDPTPKGGWISLLTVHSLDELDWCWHDGDKLMVFIQPEKLAACDFSQLKSDAG